MCWEGSGLFLLFYYRVVDLHAQNARTHTHTPCQIWASSVSAFSLQYFSILIHHWPDMGMLSLSVYVSLSLSLRAAAHTRHPNEKIKAKQGEKQTPQQGELYPER